MFIHHRYRRLRACSAVVALASLQLLQACKGVLDVALPGKVPASALENSALATTLVNGVQADFECAFSEYVHTTGLWANETLNSSGNGEVNGWGARTSNYDNGILPCQTVAAGLGNYSTYLPLQTARVQAENAITALDGYTDAQVASRAQLTATAATYAGFSYTLLGEAYCQMATGPNDPLITPAQTLALAEARFTRAIALATTLTTAKADTLRKAAYIGRARVRLDLKNYAGSAADAKQVTDNKFVFNATYSAAAIRRNNTAYVNQNVNFHESVAPEYRDLTVNGVPDRRVPVKNLNRLGHDAVTPMWAQQKYLSVSASIPVARWDEAQLIIAEAEGAASAVTAINNLRARDSLPAYAGAGTQADIIEERRRALFFDGHRLGDKLRLGIPFPTGRNQKGVLYGDLTCLPLPSSETIGRP
jgi:hypothetical protein